MSERQVVNKTARDVYSDYIDFFDGKTSDEIIKTMTEFKRVHPNRDLYFKFIPYGYDGGVDLFVYERRLENDEEYLERMELETKAKDKVKAKEAKELAEYKRLKAKYESSEI